ncbi:hypothetical protein HAX54_020936 [Datura stramonium]|uniref:DUF7953 domain-containing protein n=1 Tax=Datura stramonium TaxID=4076 RepID=A0ABS8UU89_DATST|nr:hypothetical protein [Datura stramonium]
MSFVSSAALKQNIWSALLHLRREITLDELLGHCYNTRVERNCAEGKYPSIAIMLKRLQCKGENKTILPDVKKKHVLYIFKGEESWQLYPLPDNNSAFLSILDYICVISMLIEILRIYDVPLTELSNKKCKRCGVYEKDTIKPDDTFDEWELCASDFTSPHGKYIHYLNKEFKATFLCPDCVPHRDASHHSSGSPKGGKRMHWAFLLLICAFASIVLVLGAVTIFKCWKKKKRQQEQARFLKLFEEDDDMEDELGIGPLSHVI